MLLQLTQFGKFVQATYVQFVCVLLYTEAYSVALVHAENFKSQGNWFQSVSINGSV